MMYTICKLALVILGVSLSHRFLVTSTPLDDYVNKADPSYDYYVLEDYTRRVDGLYTVYVLNMTSQTWLDESIVDRPVWWHYLSVTIPDNIRYSDVGFMYITGGNNNAGPPDPLDDNSILLASAIAVEAGVVAGNLKQIPNQPLVFKEDPKNKSRSEDAAIAFTWSHFIKNGTDQPEYVLQLPMTKAAIRGFDTIKDWSHKIRPDINITKFMPAGRSKRGWITWLTGVVDNRVFAMAPIVLDVLNLVENLHHHYRSLGGWTFAFNDYYEEEITQYLDDPNTQLLADFIDPIKYNDRLTMPKFIFTGANDQFFLPDDSHYYYDQLMGPKYLRIVPNAEHSFTLHQFGLMRNLGGFLLAVRQGWQLPSLSWTRYENATHGIIELTTDQIPVEVKAWKGRTLRTGDGRRDWRIMVAREPGNADGIAINPALFRSFGVNQVNSLKYMHKVVIPIGFLYNTGVPYSQTPTEYVAAFHRPFSGWEAFEIEASFIGPDNVTLTFSTEMNIMPGNAWASTDCSGPDCRGIIV